MASSPPHRNARALFPAALIMLLLDQVTKYWAQGALAHDRTIPLLGPFLSLKLTHNTGAAFGLMPGAGVLLTLLAAVAAIVLVAYGRRFASDRLRTASVALLLGGALGNLVDRIRLGHVVDFIASSYWPTFNVADIAITVGAILLGLSLMRKTR